MNIQFINYCEYIDGLLKSYLKLCFAPTKIKNGLYEFIVEISCFENLAFIVSGAYEIIVQCLLYETLTLAHRIRGELGVLSNLWPDH